MKKLIFVLILVLQFAPGFSQSKKIKYDYLGQKPPGNIPELFAPGIVSVKGRYEYSLAISHDGNEIFFTTESPGDGLMVIHRNNGIWGKPEPANLRGNNSWEFEAFYSPYGSKLYFSSNVDDVPRIWFCEREKSGWSKPEMLDSPVNSTPAFWATVSNDKTLYYTNLEARKIYKSEWIDGKYSKTEDIGLPFGGHPTISPDERFLLFNYKGDLFVSFNKKGSWSEPIAFDENINTTFGETCPCLSPDGKYIFFSRYNEPENKSNIYWVSSKIIDNVN
ncbi:MAG: PD40 domain-containing protein [Prolixibacteraceae bacterium]|nr:PD40 domain-containing protein [Prolixibacteraceae bacterium]MBN2775619.1 PD40 domain-containing protein [Prolixibacteraceae bacterium]